MNQEHFTDSSLDDSLAIDRLVDGEMDDEGRLQLLSSLDYTRDGWRRLALAFVEAQTWQADLGELAAEVHNEDCSVVSPARAQKAPGRLTVLLAMAASFALAFCLAWLLRPAFDSSGPVADDPQFAQENVGQPIDESQSLVESKPELPADKVATDREPIDLPLIHVQSGEDDPWRHVAKPALPANIAEMLERSGHRVQSQRSVYPIKLRDGRRVVVPVEQVDVELETTRGYQ